MKYIIKVKYKGEVKSRVSEVNDFLSEVKSRVSEVNDFLSEVNPRVSEVKSKSEVNK